MIRLIIKNKTFVDRNVVVNFKPGECMRKSFFSQQRKWLVRQNPSIANGSRTYDLLKNVLILWLILFFFSTENLDRDQRRNLFAQEQSKKVQQLRIIMYWR